MTIVVDASVVSKLIFPEPLAEQAFALFDTSQRTGEVIAAPFLLPVELTNLIRKRMRRDRLPLSAASMRLAQVLALPFDLLEPPDLHQRALELCEEHSLGGHDAHYVALAQMLSCDLWVDEGHLLRAVQGRLPFVRWIG